MSEFTKEKLLELIDKELEEYVDSPIVVPRDLEIIRSVIEQLPLCDETIAVIETEEAHEKEVPEKKKKKRKPSAYNIFMGKCMKEEKKSMKECAAVYKQRK